MYNRNINKLSAIIQSPIAPRSTNVLWDDLVSNTLKVYRKGVWTVIGGAGGGGEGSSLYWGYDDIQGVIFPLDNRSVQINGDLTVNGDITARKLNVAELEIDGKSFASYWELDSNTNTLSTTYQVLIKNSLVVEQDTSSGGDGQDTPSAGLDEEQLQDYLDLHKYVTEDDIEGLIPDVDLSEYAKTEDVKTAINEVGEEIDSLSTLLSSMWHLDENGNLMTEKQVLIKNNLIVEQDTSSGGEGQDTPGGGGGVSEEDVLEILEKNNYITSSALSSYYTKAESDNRYLASSLLGSNTLIHSGNIGSQSVASAKSLVASNGTTYVSYNSTYGQVNVNGINIGYGGNTIECATSSKLYIQKNVTQDTILNMYGGNVGIGTESPAYKLDVNGSIAASEYLTVRAWTGYGSGSANAWYNGNTQMLLWENVSGMGLGSNVVLHSGNIGSYAFVPKSEIANNTDADYLLTNGVYLNATGNGGGNSNFPQSYSIFATFAQSEKYLAQLSIGNNSFYFRRKIDTWDEWREVIHSGNIGSQSVAGIRIGEQIRTQEALDAFNDGKNLRFVGVGSVLPSPIVGSDGIVISIPWYNTTFGAQIAIDDQSNVMLLRTRNQNVWNPWYRFITAKDDGYVYGLGGMIDIQYTDEINRYGGNLYLQHRGVVAGEGTGGNYTGNVIMCDNGGNVGIGTADPLSKLQVVGQINVSHNSYKNYAFISQDDYTSNTSWMKLGTCYGYQTETVAMTIYNGMVKIGNAIPTCELDVNGAIKATKPIFGYMYGTNNNAAAFIFDKPGLNYTGIGSDGVSDTIRFGACDINGTWVSYNQKWKFYGDIIVTGDVASA